MQVVVPKFQRTSLENLDYRTRNRWIPEPQGSFRRPVKQFLGETKFFRRREIRSQSQTSQKSNG
jgi:hypothetical protein